MNYKKKNKINAMKKLLLLIMLLPFIALNGCKQPIEDNRNPDLLNFIKFLGVQNNNVVSSKNDILLDDNINLGVENLTKYTIDTLHKKFIKWDAEIIDIKNKPYGLDLVTIEFMILNNINDTDNTYPEFSSIILSTSISIIDKKVIDKIKQHKVKDKVKISGSFNYKNNVIDLDKYVTTSSIKNLFENPKIEIQLEDIL